MACAGAGIAYVPDYVAREGLEDGRLERLFPDYEGEHWSVQAVFPDRRYLTAKVRVFVDFLIARLGDAAAVA